MISKKSKESPQVSTIHAAVISVITSNRSRVASLNKWTKQTVSKNKAPLPVLWEDSLSIPLDSLSLLCSNPTCSQPARAVWLVPFLMDLNLKYSVTTPDDAAATTVSVQEKNFRTFHRNLKEGPKGLSKN